MGNASRSYVLGIATSILLFNTMNRLYFEEFRRAIFIKRIAGLRFLEIHHTYLFAQLGVFFTGIYCECISYGRDSELLS